MISIEEDANKFVTKFNLLFKSDFGEKKELNFYNTVMKMQEQFRAKTKGNKKYEEIIELSEEREKQAMISINERIEDLEKKYPQYKKNTFFQKSVDSLKKFGKTIFNFIKKKKKERFGQKLLMIIIIRNI